MDITDELIRAKEDVEFEILALPGVVGVGIGLAESDGELAEDLAVVVYVQDANQTPPGIPSEVGGVPVCTVERSVAPCSFLEDKGRYPDIRGAIKITQPSLGVGTLGAVVEDSSSGELLGLSCRHVIGDPSMGDPFPYTVWQPTNPPLLPPIDRSDSIGVVVRSAFPQTPTPTSPQFMAGLVDAAVMKLDEACTAGRPPSRAIAGDGIGQPNLISAVTSTLDLGGPGPAAPTLCASAAM